MKKATVLIIVASFIGIMNLNAQAYLIDLTGPDPFRPGPSTPVSSYTYPEEAIHFHETLTEYTPGYGYMTTHSGNAYWGFVYSFKVIPESGDHLVGKVNVLWTFAGFHVRPVYSCQNMTESKIQSSVVYGIPAQWLGIPVQNSDGSGSYLFQTDIGTIYNLSASLDLDYPVWSEQPTAIDPNTRGLATARADLYAGEQTFRIVSTPEPGSMLLFGLALACLAWIRRRTKNQNQY